MLYVTDLSSYLYCPRQVYFKKVEKLRVPKKEALVKGIIKHEVIEKLNEVEKQIIEDIKKPTKLTDIEQVYQKNYKSLFLKTIEKSKEDLKEFKIDPKTFFEQSWYIYQNEAAERAINISNFIEKNKLFGTDLWNNLEPKFLTEIKIVSKKLKLTGKIDKLALFKDRVVPIEMKSGKMPHQGVWDSNKVQVTAYCLLAQEHYHMKVNYGFVHYLDHDEKRKIVLNPFSKPSLLELRDKILKMIETKTVPSVEESNKCSFCDFKEKCQSLK